MGVKTTTLIIGDKLPTISDKLPSDCLTIEVTNKVSLSTGTVTQINLTVRNSSPVGRMAHLHVNYDPGLGIIVQIPDPKIYVGPESKTSTYALIEGKLGSEGQCNINWSVT